MPSGNADTITKALGPFFNQAEHDLIFGAASTGFFSYNEPSCSGAGIGGPSIATGLVGAGLGSIPVVGGTLSKLFGIFGAHHAAAVKTEQATLCQAVPDANNFLRGIDAAVAQGQLDIPTATQALEQGYQNWLAEVKSIYQTGAGKNCNAACVYAKAFRAAIEKRKLDFQLVSARVASASQGVIGGVVDAFQGAVSSIANVFSPAAPAAVMALGGAGSPATPALAQAGLTPARQGTLAGFVLIGGLLLSVVLFSNLFGGSAK